MPKLEILPAVAGLLGIVSLSTLLQTVYTTQNTSSFPYSWLAINLTAQVLGLWYGLANKAWGIWLPSIVFLLGLGYMLYVKIRYGNVTDKHKKKDQLNK
jgi:hypothetical protein